MSTTEKESAVIHTPFGPYLRTPTGKLLKIAPGTENPVSVDEMLRRRDIWYEQNKKYLEGYSVEKFLEEKHRNVEKGLE